MQTAYESFEQYLIFHEFDELIAAIESGVEEASLNGLVAYEYIIERPQEVIAQVDRHFRNFGYKVAVDVTPPEEGHAVEDGFLRVKVKIEWNAITVS